MDPSQQRMTLLTLLLSCLLSAGGFAASLTTDPDPGALLTESAITQRLKAMENDVVKPRYDIVVKSYLNTYTVRARDKAQKILGRRILYFPMFEEYLTNANIPTDLKYLAVVESALEPRAISYAGAVGLWQFMAPTGRAYGLRIDDTVDERCDPRSATQAAATYLSSLYDRFNNWELAIAAYNSGSGRVSRAVKRGRSTNYWTIRKYLPRETRNYVPAFIAASYLLKYYEDHDLVPDYPSLDMQLTETIKLYSGMTFAEISQLTEVPMETIQLLNPAYRKEIIPESPDGYNLTLPRRVIPAVKAFIESERPDQEKRAALVNAPIIISRPNESINAEYVKAVHEVLPGETLQSLAKEFKCTVYQLKTWNDLAVNELEKGQRLVFYHAKDYVPKVTAKRLTAVMALPIPVPTKIPRTTVEEPAVLPRPEKYIYYTTSRKESILSIAVKLPGVTLQDLMQLNGVERNATLRSGTRIKVKKME